MREGSYDAAAQLLERLNLAETKLKQAQFLVYEHKYLEVRSAPPGSRSATVLNAPIARSRKLAWMRVGGSIGLGSCSQPCRGAHMSGFQPTTQQCLSDDLGHQSAVAMGVLCESLLLFATRPSASLS